MFPITVRIIVALFRVSQYTCGTSELRKNKMFKHRVAFCWNPTTRYFISRNWMYDYLIEIVILPFTLDDLSMLLNMELSLASLSRAVY